MQFTPVKTENEQNKQQKGKSTRQTQSGSDCLKFLLKTDWSLVDKHWALTWERQLQSNWMNCTQHCRQLILWSHLENDETNISLTPLGTSLKGQVPTTTHTIMPSALADVTFKTIKRLPLHNFSPTDTILKVLYAQSVPPFPFINPAEDRRSQLWTWKCGSNGERNSAAKLHFKLARKWANPGRKVAVATEYCTVATNMCGSSVRTLFHITLLVPTILWWLANFLKIYAPLHQCPHCEETEI